MICECEYLLAYLLILTCGASWCALTSCSRTEQITCKGQMPDCLKKNHLGEKKIGKVFNLMKFCVEFGFEQRECIVWQWCACGCGVIVLLVHNIWCQHSW